MAEVSQIAKILASNIRANRDRIGLSQLDLALKVGVSDATVTAWEAGRRWPGTENITSLAGVFGVSESSLYIDQSNQQEVLNKAAMAIIRAVHEREYKDILDALAKSDAQKLDRVRMILGLLDSKPLQKSAKKKP